MAQFDLAGRELEHSNYKAIAASQTTANISTAGDGVPGRDYIHHIVCIPASSAAAGWTLLDGTTNVMVVPTMAGTGTGVQLQMPYTVHLGITATSTKGFQITTAAANSVVVVGRF